MRKSNDSRVVADESSSFPTITYVDCIELRGGGCEEGKEVVVIFGESPKEKISLEAPRRRELFVVGSSSLSMIPLISSPPPAVVET